MADAAVGAELVRGRRPGRCAPEAYPELAGSASCRECHEEEYDAWLGSHHAKAQRDLESALDRSAFVPERAVEHGTQRSSVRLEDGRYVIRTTGPDGELHDYTPDGVLGVYPLWQYIVPFGEGRWQVTELAFDPDKQEWFNVYGEEDRRPEEWGHWSNRGMNWNSMCATCHTTAFDKRYRPATDGYDSTYAELGIGCEQCHGPMKDHVDWQNKNKDQPGDPTLPGLDREAYFSSCGSCHARRSDLTGEFAVGEKFTDHYDIILPDLSDVFYADGQIREEDFEFAPFLLSYMQNRGIRCFNCHDAHSAKPYYDGNELCLRCHQYPVTTKRAIDEVEHGHHAEYESGNLCTDCHMPQTPYMQRHWRHDHGFTIPDPLLTKRFGIPNACTRCHDDKDVDWSLDYVKEWYGERMDRPSRRRAILLAEVKSGDLSRVPELLSVLESEENPAWRAVIMKFLTAALDRGGREVARATVEAVTPLLEDEDPLAQAVAVETLEPISATLVDKIRPLLDGPSRLVRIKAAWALRRRLDFDTPAGRDLLANLTYNRDQPTGAFQWAHLYASRGELETATKWYKKAIEWGPRAGPIRHGYAVLLSEMGRLEEAETQLEQAARMEPENPLYPYSLGLLYGEQNRLTEALEAISRAIELDGQQSRFWYNLALVHSQMGNHDKAIEAIDRAEQLEPYQPDYPYTRATILLQEHRVPEALDALETALQISPTHTPSLQLQEHLFTQGGG